MMNAYNEADWGVSTDGDVFSPSFDHRDSLGQFNPFQDYETTTPSSAAAAVDTTSRASTPDLPTTTDTNASNVYMKIHVDDPQKQSAAVQGSFISYLITTETNIETFASKRSRSVRRRYQDFVWLHESLSLENPACIVPPLPEKHRLSYINGDRFSDAFLERRRLGLQWFLDRIACHPSLQRSQCTRIFLESPDFKNDKRAIQATHVPKPPSILDTLGDVLMNAFTKVKKPDQRFIDMQEYVDKLEDNIRNIELLYARISKRQTSLQHDYVSFAWSIREISAMESSIDMPLRQFAETTETYSKYLKDMTNTEDILFLNDLHELLAYCQAVKDVLQRRDESQIDFEELSVYLQRTLAEREKHPEKSAELEPKIKELEAEVAKTSDITNEFSEQMTEEFEIFQKSKATELKQGMLAYADSHIDFYTKGAALWESILPVLESIQLDDDGNNNTNNSIEEEDDA
ncbi:hypothetical protein O0I10_008487 [Lichtheimia ornata]|uniref:Sorting nexin-4 n=1 Tax=Lichtheimia ornata TaxID=688661 RepID=A0AAD7XWT6_9FUNG|nr:uncharacterized protein O0I10_008487 [Lichtheimia ornata]KAJ8655823.1 hypothetical protein O0I10_008487 [Lichtheimia ornata]